MFYAGYCGHCTAFKPEYGKAAKVLKEQGILLAMVEGTEETDVAEIHEIQSYPTLKWFPKGTKTDKLSWKYDGERTEAGVLKWVKAALLRGNQKPREWDEVHDEASFNSLCGEIRGICVLLAGPQSKKEHMYENIKGMLAKDFENIPFFFSWVIAEKQPSLMKYLKSEGDNEKVKTIM